MFHPKIIHYEGEGDGAPFVSPQSLCVGAFIVSMWCKPFAKEFVGKYPCLGETPYCPFHPKVYKSVESEFVEVVLLLYPFRENSGIFMYSKYVNILCFASSMYLEVHTTGKA